MRDAPPAGVLAGEQVALHPDALGAGRDRRASSISVFGVSALHSSFAHYSSTPEASHRISRVSGPAGCPTAGAASHRAARNTCALRTIRISQTGAPAHPARRWRQQSDWDARPDTGIPTGGPAAQRLRQQGADRLACSTSRGSSGGRPVACQDRRADRAAGIEHLAGACQGR